MIPQDKILDGGFSEINKRQMQYAYTVERSRDEVVGDVQMSSVKLVRCKV